jgi:hypothetical protein
LRGLPFVVAAACIWFVWAQIAGYGANLVRNRDWVARVEVPTLSALHEAVFKRLFDNGLIWAERRPGLVFLRYTPCTSSTRAAPDTAVVHGAPTQDQRRQLIDLLCRSPQGQFIQNEVEAWNLSYELLALRDNRNVNLPVIRPAAARPRAAAQRPNEAAAAASTTARRCTNSAVVAHFFVPPGCYENVWEATYVRDGIRTPAAISANAEPPPRDYAFLAAEGITYPGDWRTLTPFAGDRVRGEAAAPVGHYEFTTDIMLGSDPVSIHVAGHVFDMRIGSADWSRKLVPPGEMPPRLVPQTSQVAGLKVEVDVLCSSSTESENPKICLTPAARDEASAYQITLSSSARRSDIVRIGFRVLPSLVPAGELADADDKQEVILRRAINIEANCQGPHPKREPPAAGRQVPEPGACSLTWLEARSMEQRGAVNAQAFMRSGTTSLVEPNGILTDAAFEDGMAEVVGLGPTTFGSLAQGLVRARNLNGPVRLTIDPDLQRRARDVLSKNIRCNPRARRANTAKCNEATRGTLVVMDADSGRTGGEILAVASWPRMDRGLGAWDLAALDAGQPSESPIAGNGWRAHDISAMAGSTFKIVTSLAAVQQALDTGDASLSAILMGTSPLNELQNRLSIQKAEAGWRSGKCKPTSAGSSPGDAIVVMNAQKSSVLYCLGNARKETAPDLFEGGLEAYRRACGGMANRIGMCEALAMSSNLYFGGLALYVDLPRLEQQGSDSKTAIHDLPLVKMARRLFPDGLGEGAPADARRRDFPLVRGMPFSPSRLGASPFILPAEAARVAPHDGPRQLDLALNGFGQAVTATPLTLATTYASFGSRTIIRPTLVPLDTPRDQRGDSFEGQPLLVVPPNRQADYDKLMTTIARGLNGVMTAGTAMCSKKNCRFPWSSLPQQLQDAIYIKTGTATLSESEEGGKNMYSAWIAGYVEPPRGIRSGITKRTAFACHIARTRDFGGDACASIIGTLITELHARSQQ